MNWKVTQRKGGPHLFTGCALLGLILCIASVPAFAVQDESGLEPFRFAFSMRMFSGVNENDAKAAVRGWAQGLANERKIQLDGQPVMLQNLKEIIEAMRGKRVDCISLTTDDYLALPPDLQSTNLLVSLIAGKTTEQYLLLVHAKSGLGSLADMKGRSLVVQDHPRASLSTVWLEVIVAQQGLGLPAQHFGLIRKAQKLTAVVLPVFFRQQDACIVTRSGFNIMAELNPQLRVQLKTLAVSPELVPAFTFIRPDYRGVPQDEIVEEVLKMHATESGKQILTLFQSDRIVQEPASVLDTARDLTERARRLIPPSGPARLDEALPAQTIVNPRNNL